MAKNSRKILRNRALVAFFVTVVLVFGMAIYGLVLQGVIHGSANRSKAEAELLSDRTIYSQRGTIYDRNGNVLAQSSDAWKIFINPSEIAAKDTASAETVAEDLAKVLDLDYDEVLKSCKLEKRTYVVVKSKVDYDTKTAIEKLKAANKDEGYMRIIGIEDDVTRFYPYDNFASTIIGFTGADDSGRSGLEFYYNESLNGVAGRRIGAKNAKASAIPSAFDKFFAVQQGYNLELTIDNAIQYFLDSALSSAVNSLDASYGYGIVMDTKTGAILAMSSQPDYDLNNPYSVANEATKAKLDKIEDKDDRAKETTAALNAQWRNRTITDTYEPGSVFKCVTAAAGIEEGVVSPEEMFVCTGEYQVQDRTYHCSNRAGHGSENFTTSLMNSCNPIYIQVAQRLGKSTFSKYFDAFGFTETTGVDLPAEARPIPNVTYYAEDKMGSVQLASASFGQTFQVSPIQCITAINAIANDGKLMQPYIVDRYLDDEGNPVAVTQPVEKRQVVSKLTADTVTDMMVEVVKGGTAKNAYVPGYSVAGKTGTSEKLGEASDYYIGSFCGFAPADDPEITVLIVIDEPKGASYTGGKTAAPVAAEVIENTLKYLNVEPEYTAEERASLDVKTPNEIGISTKSAKASLEKSGFKVFVVGDGEKVLNQSPAAGKLVPSQGVIVLYTEDAKKTQKVNVPNLTGLTVQQARYAANQVGLNVEIVGNTSATIYGSSYRQSISQGTGVAMGSTITVSYMTTDSEMSIEDTGNAD